MRIYPASHYAMGGLWVDYNLMTTIPGLFAAGEANFSDHGANRLGASALMQGLSDGYFVLPFTVGNYLGTVRDLPEVRLDHADVRGAVERVENRIHKLLNAPKPSKTADEFHRELGALIWDKCGMARNEAGLKEAIEKIPEIRERFWEQVKVPGTGEAFNQTLERAGRVADFMEFAELLSIDALSRDESCGAHFREEHQSEEGEAVRDDEHFQHVSAWEFTGDVSKPKLHKEPLVFERLKPSTRSYK